ncbi:MAG TPA: hypothetical protein ENN88_00555, partial [Candidatus Coatesbacteria bacterium]|nr:hypothetical protein [Candidatus Coatesbacteria bacterium]
MKHLFVSPATAASGEAVELETGAGRLRVALPPGMESGVTLRLRGAGKRGLFGRRRDLLVRVFVLNSLSPVEEPAEVDAALVDEVDFVLRYVRGEAAKTPLEVEALYRDFLDRGDPSRFQAALAASAGEEPVPVEFSGWLEVPGLVQMVERPPMTGIPEQPEPRRIYVAEAFRDDPLAVGSILAHESAHVFLFRRGYYRVLNPAGSDPEGPNQLDVKDERLTDLAVFG